MTSRVGGKRRLGWAWIPVGVLLTCLWGLAAAWAATPDPVFEVATLAATPLEARVESRIETNGIVIEEVRFLSEMDGTNRVEIFAYFCYPTGAHKLPALIWNQSGLARASTHFPLLLARRGYAALCLDFPQAGYRSTGGYLINSGLTLTDDPAQAPIAHGVKALIKAVSFLQSRPEADPDRIGMAGSSWGGFFTTLAMGVDDRIQAASSMFGCGMLQEGCVWFYGEGRPPDAEYLARWGRTLDPAFRLPDLTRPIAWFSGCNDHFFWLGPLLATHARPAGPKHLALLPNWDHGLTPELDDQVFAWLDIHLKGEPPFIAAESPRVERNEEEQSVFRWDWKSSVRKPVAAEVAISFGKPGNWKTRYWKVLPATLGEGVCEAVLPRVGLPILAFGTVVETNGYRSSTTAIEVPAATNDVKLESLDYNGCSMWGDFESKGMAYLTGLGLLRAKVAVTTNQARSGCQALVVRETTSIPTALYYTAGLSHRFSVFARSDEPATLTVTLEGKFDGQPKTWSVETATGPDWVEVAIPFTPPDCKAPNLGVTFKVVGGPVSLDDVSLKPVE
jgi:dienelactone hydrolase